MTIDLSVFLEYGQIQYQLCLFRFFFWYFDFGSVLGEEAHIVLFWIHLVLFVHYQKKEDYSEDYILIFIQNNVFLIFCFVLLIYFFVTCSSVPTILIRVILYIWM